MCNSLRKRNIRRQPKDSGQLIPKRAKGRKNAFSSLTVDGIFTNDTRRPIYRTARIIESLAISLSFHLRRLLLHKLLPHSFGGCEIRVASDCDAVLHQVMAAIASGLDIVEFAHAYKFACLS